MDLEKLMDWGTVWTFFAPITFLTKEKVSLGSLYCRRLSQLVAPSIALNSFKIAARSSKKRLFRNSRLFRNFQNCEFCISHADCVKYYHIIIIIQDATLRNLRTEATLRRRGVSLFHILTVSYPVGPLTYPVGHTTQQISPLCALWAL